tara:strand:+ start:1251 stop:2945 length:1695 start_codon:yes stop_codon:yes gene_type:complete
MATFYVSAQTGDDGNDGTSAANAKATLQAGLDALSSAGDILYIAPGIYRGIFDMDNAVNGTTSANNKIIGDPDCEQFPGEEKGVIRITNTDKNDINAQTSNSTVLGRVFEITKLRTCLHNLHVDGGGNPFLDAADMITQHLSYGFYGVSEGYYNCFNCLAQCVYTGFYRVNTTNCIAVSTYLGYQQGYKHVHSLSLAASSGFYLADYVVDCVAIGAYTGAFRDNDNVCNAFALGGGYAFRASTGDEIHDSVGLGSSFGYFGSQQGSGGIISGSYIGGGSIYAGYRGRMSNTMIGPGVTRMQSSTANIPNSTGFTIGDNGTKVGPSVLYSYTGLWRVVEAVKPTLLNHGLRGLSDSHHDDTSRNYEAPSGRIPVPHKIVETDILGHPRAMGFATHSLHNMEANISARDLGAYEYSSVEYTSSISQSGEGIAINGEGIQSFLIPVLSGSVFSASVNIMFSNNIVPSIDQYPGMLVKYMPGYPSSSTETGGTLANYYTGSQLIITSSYLTAGNSMNQFHNVSLNVPASNINQIYDLQLQSRATGSIINNIESSGSTFNTHFSDLEIT